MKRRGDAYPYCAKTLLLNAEDGKNSGESDFCNETCGLGAQLARRNTSVCVERGNSSLLGALAAEGSKCDRRDSD